MARVISTASLDLDLGSDIQGADGWSYVPDRPYVPEEKRRKRTPHKPKAPPIEYVPPPPPRAFGGGIPLVP